MAFVLNDRVKETTTTTGTGTLNLAGAATGFETFVAGIGNSNVTYYCIAGQGTAEFEVGIGTVTDASPDTLSRTTILSSSNSDSAVNFSAGTKDVFCTLPAGRTIREADTALNVPTGTTAQRAGSPAAGDFRYNTTTGRFEGYLGSAWGSFGSSNSFFTNIFAGDGSDTTFTLSQTIDNENDLLVFVDGVFQAQNVYSVSGTTLTFATAPANGRVITVYSVKAGVSGSNYTLSTMTGDGSDTTLTLGTDPVNENNVQVYIDGVYQNKDTFSVSGTTLTFSEAPPNNTKVEAIVATQTTINTATQLLDADGDTKVMVEESSDEDKIRFDTGGTERMVIDSTGVGIGTTSPDFLLDVEGSNTQMKVGAASQDGGFLTSTDNNQLILSGGFYYNGSNFIAASTSASGVAFDNGTAAFYNNTSLTDGNSFTLTETMRVASSGNLLLGTTSATATEVRLDVQYSANPIIQVRDTTNNVSLWMQATDSVAALVAPQDSSLTFGVGASQATRMTITSSGNIGAPSGTNIYNASDVRLKQNVNSLSNCLNIINNLNPITFNWADNFEEDEKDKTLYGFVAQEVQDVFPDAVEDFSSGDDIELNGETIENPLAVREKFIIPVLVKAMQEQQAQIEALQSEINTLKG